VIWADCFDVPDKDTLSPMKRSTQSPTQSFSDPDRTRQVITITAVFVSIFINTISNIFPLNGVNIGKLSNTVFAAVQIIPANYAFSIWGLIYLALIAFSIYQLQSSQRQNPGLQGSAYFLVIASIAQCIWIYLFLARLFPLSCVAILGVLLPLIGMYRYLGIGQRQVSSQERWLIHFPISIYCAWITVATVVNVAVTLYSLDWDGWGIDSPTWTVIMMVVSTAIAALVTIRGRNMTYAIVIAWALVAISIRQISVPVIALSGIVLAISLILVASASRVGESRLGTGMK
jgi:hypothetical protein